jgi:hypothetical protein
VKQMNGASLVLPSTLLANISLGWKSLAGTNTLANYDHSLAGTNTLANYEHGLTGTNTLANYDHSLTWTNTSLYKHFK